MTERAKWALLAGLVLAWAVLFVSQVLMEPDPQQAPLTYKTGYVRPRANQSPATKQPSPVHARLSTFRPPKNIFAPLDQPETKLPRDLFSPNDRGQTSGQRQIRTRVAKKLPPAAPSSAPASPSPPPPPPTPSAADRAAQMASQQLGQYRFLGYIVQRGESVAFLEKGHNVYLVKTGDMVDKTVQVKAIDSTSVKLMEATTATEATLPLTKDSTRSS